MMIKNVYHPNSLSRPFSGNRQQHSSPAKPGFTSDGGKDVVYATNRTTKTPDGVPRVRERPKVERHVRERVLRGTMSQTTTRDPKHTCTEISTTGKVLSPIPSLGRNLAIRARIYIYIYTMRVPARCVSLS